MNRIWTFSTKRPLIIVIATLLGVHGLMGCQDLTTKRPAGSVDPHFYETADGAMQIMRNARYEFMESLFNFMLDAGLISDEFYAVIALNNQVVGVFDAGVVLDSRVLPDLSEAPPAIWDFINTASARSYERLQRVRSRADLARHALRAYAPQSPQVLQAEMMAYTAFAEIMLADLYCSGIPLSLVVFDGDFEYKPGSSTRSVYEHAVTLFDTAIALAVDEANIRMLAQVGKARALLNLGRYAEAATAVADVPPNFSYSIPLQGTAVSTNNPNGVDWIGTSASNFGVDNRGRVADNKGTNGLDYLSSNDPRIQTLCRNVGVLCAWRLPAVRTQLTVATSVESQLITAEAALHAGQPDQFLAILNALRTDGSTTVDGLGVTQYGAGIGGVAGLPPLSDPGAGASTETLARTARVDLLMRERAFWLFFTGHRQGDLRRLLRHYDRTVESVYPAETYPAGRGMYDAYVDIPIPKSEYNNPYYRGCLGRGE